MKRSCTVLLVALFGFWFLGSSGCGGKEDDGDGAVYDTPEDVFAAARDAAHKKNWRKFKNCLTTTSRRFVAKRSSDELASLTEGWQDIQQVLTDGDQGRARLMVKSADAEVEKSIAFQRVDGSWLIALPEADRAGRPEGGHVEGRVLYNGRPVTGGMLFFAPVQGGVHLPTVIEVSGRYIGLDVPLGEMKVYFDTEGLKAAMQRPNGPGGGIGGMPGGPGGGGGPPGGAAGEGLMPNPNQREMPKYVALPAKYRKAETTPLTITIRKGKQVQDFELRD